MFESFKNKNWRLYFLSQIFALLGSTVQLVVVSWLAYKVTDSAAILGLVVSLQYLPILIFGLFAGHFLDKFSKHRSLQFLQIFQAGLPFLIALWIYFSGVNVYNLVAAAVMFGVLKVFDGPLRHSFLSYLVPKDEVKQAYSLYANASQVARTLGPVVGGLILLFLNPLWSFVLMGILYIVVMYLYSQMDSEKFYIHKDTKNHDSNIKDSLLYLLRNQTLRDITIVGAYVAVFFWSYNAYLPVMVETMLVGSFGAMSFSLLVSAYALGAIFGNFYTSTHKDMSYSHLRKILISYSISGLIFATITNFYFSFIVMFVSGIFIAQINAITNALVRVNSDEKYLGTMMSFWLLITVGFTAFGSIYYGYMAEHFGIQIALLIPPALFLLFSIFYFGKGQVSGRIE